jgi:hypothetical protein
MANQDYVYRRDPVVMYHCCGDLTKSPTRLVPERRALTRLSFHVHGYDAHF